MTNSGLSATLILVMVFTLATTLTQGRHLKLDTKKQEVQQSIFVVAIRGHDQGIAFGTSPTNGSLAHDLHGEPILGSLGELEGSPIRAPSRSDQGTHESPPGLGHNIDGFRPTSPGHSPGIGRHLMTMMNSHGHGDHATYMSSSGTDSTVDGFASPAPGHDLDDFRPTTPGHSPGIGH
ncbi:hypothetical protein Sjap_022384 [Stephania japonica]|uniref:Uncharacterized protein n=1 Tax=Stephania japonica TaxID=461633 RepID=A0AAP0EU50_9MAGN